ncbi:hypothetical protein BO94DRAFT_153553 [Aspergillus sclerotioniger CBS 115572]|uniref:Uncharacterized protein n=1 Tax=Aspergillus sclerotioniger CBS 115572 TaxID=1450535 RepID=A0A317W369_9EURO|nr:hypothetical protein BO94DRAFT_153553 [Aspergillus sclerotioniger CBS 115572]PWY80953.1 hypothetical protein BO94DRAFT_153553 [Aspergillus sclerotioniger CBS 115572]
MDWSIYGFVLFPSISSLGTPNPDVRLSMLIFEIRCSEPCSDDKLSGSSDTTKDRIIITELPRRPMPDCKLSKRPTCQESCDLSYSSPVGFPETEAHSLGPSVSPHTKKPLWLIPVGGRSPPPYLTVRGGFILGWTVNCFLKSLLPRSTCVCCHFLDLLFAAVQQPRPAYLSLGQAYQFSDNH